MTPPIEPDTKNWTWVLEKTCTECGFTAAEVEVPELGSLIRANAAVWVEALARPDARTRPRDDVWSPVEYGAHVRDVHRLFAVRVRMMLEQDCPTFANWDQDATALAERYDLADPATVSVELVDAAEAVAAIYDAVQPEQYERAGLRSNGSEFTVTTIGRYHLHDDVHHLGDVAP
ncbi:DinB family protein [Nocardioides sp. R-C-SC26]|uniref:DinB family protein n=1 Tax=Nocardioides sp. R-C-SC26 TaxID=2870414 RepID=UPI001E471FCF|nr:DinB family protein [Nocardioides sp. R-C-SC26]